MVMINTSQLWSGMPDHRRAHMSLDCESVYRLLTPYAGTGFGDFFVTMRNQITMFWFNLSDDKMIHSLQI